MSGAFFPLTNTTQKRALQRDTRAQSKIPIINCVSWFLMETRKKGVLRPKPFFYSRKTRNINSQSSADNIMNEEIIKMKNMSFPVDDGALPCVAKKEEK